MAILRNTTFDGVEADQGKINSPIEVDDVFDTAQDQALVFEKLHHIDADGNGGAPPVNTGHDHSETGNILPWPVMCQHMGNSNGGPAHISDAFSTAPEVVWAFPVWLPRVSDYWIILDCGDGRYFSAELRDGSSNPAPVAGQSNRWFYQLDGGVDQNGNAMVALGAGTGQGTEIGQRNWVAVVTPAAAGLHTVFISAGRAGVSFSAVNIDSIMVMPVVQSALPLPTKPDSSYSIDQVQVGDPDATVANDWHEIDSAFAQADRGLDAVVTLLAGNDALLQESARGIPAAGNSALTLPQVQLGPATRRGHDHSNRLCNDGTNDAVIGTGRSISYSVGSWAWGTRDPDASITGGNTHAPRPNQKMAYEEFTRWQVWLHQHANATAGGSPDSGLYVVLLLEHDPGKDEVDIRVTLNPSGVTPYALDTGTIDNTTTYRLETLGPYTYTPEALNEVLIEMVGVGNDPDGRVALIGMAMYFNPP